MSTSIGECVRDRERDALFAAGRESSGAAATTYTRLLVTITFNVLLHNKSRGVLDPPSSGGTTGADCVFARGPT